MDIRTAARVGLNVDSANPNGAPQPDERLGFTIDRRDGLWVKVL